MKPVGELDYDELCIVIIKRHPFGLIAQQLGFFVASVLAIGFILFGLPEVADKGTSAYVLISSLVMISIAIFLLLAFAFLVLYYESKIIVTNKNVTQILQKGIFNRQTSQLSFANVEDVTASKKGVFSTFFNFGTLTIETAGEQNNFVFKYCPNVNMVAKQILEAREGFIDTVVQDAEIVIEFGMGWCGFYQKLP